MRTVTFELLKQRHGWEEVSFPDRCCYCQEPATDTVLITVREVLLNIPYCAGHLSPARDYVDRIVTQAGFIFAGLNLVLAICMVIAALLLFEDASTGTKVIIGIVGFVVGFFLAMPATLPMVRIFSNRGAKKLGFSPNSTDEAPGILSVVVKEDKAAGKRKIELTFADDTYADLFRATQEPAEPTATEPATGTTAQPEDKPA